MSEGKKVTAGTLAKGAVKDSYSAWSSLGTKTKVGVLGIAGGVIGFANSDHGVTGSLVDGAVGAGLSIGAGLGAEYIVEKHGEKISEKSSNFLGTVKKEITIGDIAKEQAKAKTENAAETLAESKKVKNNLRKMGLAGAIGLTAFGVASVIDTNKQLNQDKRVERTRNEQDKNLEQKRMQEQKVMSQYKYGGPSDMGSLAIDMFNQRIGHHLMGNAKFQ